MRALTLIRGPLGEGADALFGELAVGRVRFLTLENAKKRAPAGTYRVVWEFSARFKRELYELKDVPGRTEIKIHPANMARELDGCIALGRMYGEINRELGLLKSRQAMDHFEQIMGGEPFELEIRDHASPSSIV